MVTIDIVIPVYNEEDGIRLFHQELHKELHSLNAKYDFNLIYVLDRSRDKSLIILRQLAAQDPGVTVLHLSRRFGHQMSLVAGIDHSSGDALIMMDSDLQHPPSVIKDLLQKFEEGYDIVHTLRAYDQRIGFLKRCTSKFFYKFQNALSPVQIQDGAADFRLISAKVVRVFRDTVREQNQFLRGLFQWVGFESTSITFVSPPRVAGKTKYDLFRLLTFSLAGITSFSKIPLRLSSLIGFTISTLSALYGAWLIFLYFTVGHLPPGYTSLIVLILFMGGLQLTVLGILGEYLGGMFDEVKRRPLYVIDEIIGGSRR